MAWISRDPSVTLTVSDDGVARIPLFRRDGTHVWVELDEVDLPKVIAFSWYEARTPGYTSYAHASIGSRKAGTRRAVLMHRILTDAPAGLHVDHRDGNGLNNRRANIRVATPSQNRANEANRVRPRSPYKGVHWIEKEQGWRAYLGCEGKNHHLGTYEDSVSAALAHDDEARRVYGEFARTNFTEAEASDLPRGARRRRASPHGLSRYIRRKCRCDKCSSAYRLHRDVENAKARAKRAERKAA